jgi:hypothetical protein
VSGQVGREDGQGAAHQCDRAVGMSTASSPVHLVETTFESWQKSVVSFPAGQSRQVVCDRRQSERARAALTGTLTGKVASDAGRLSEAAGCLAESDDHTDSSRGADGAQWDGCVGGPEMSGCDPRASISPDKERLYGFDGLAPLSDVPQRGALVHLDDAGVGHGATQGHEAGAGVLSHSASPKRSGTVAGDESDVGQRLGVVHQGRAFSYAEWNAFVRAKNRSGARRFQPVGQRGFFTCDEAIGREDEFFAHPDVTLCPPLLHGMTYCSDNSDAAVGHADHDAITATQGGKVLGPVEHQVGRTREQNLVLAAGRLSFHRIDDDDAALAGRLGNGQFHGGGKGSTSTTCEARLFQAGHETVLPGIAAPARHVEWAMGIEMPLQVSRLAQELVGCLQRRCRARTRGHPDALPCWSRRVA